MKMYQVDAFTTALFKGNPAAVIISETWPESSLMQNIALENNLSETAFVKVLDQDNYAIRWFTPSTEVDFCGHATLASALVLFRDYTPATSLQFHIQDLGIFKVSQAEDGKISMNFPLRAPVLSREVPEQLSRALSQPLHEVYVNAQAFIVVYDSAAQVMAEQPDLALLKQIGQQYQRSVAITARAQEHDCISRYFAPHKGIDEDPVTGSLHTGIAPLWAEKLGKDEIVAYQASTRGGVLYCKLLEQERIEISGYGQLYMTAELYL